MLKKGDTLVEVTLAIGIFSLVAIAVVAVMSNGTAGAQTALEATLTREEVDSQAEALRFIQSAYIADRDTEDDRFANLWKVITKNALDITNTNEDYQSSIVQYSPNTCDELYDSTIENHYGFVIDVNYLGKFSAFTKKEDAIKHIPDVVVSASSRRDMFAPSVTYPHLVYGSDTSSSDNETLISDISSSNLYRAEGIYIVAVKDADNTVIVSDEDPQTTSAFYDFYIRTCWYGIGEKAPSVISTIVRLYDPEVIRTNNGSN